VARIVVITRRNSSRHAAALVDENGRAMSVDASTFAPSHYRTFSMRHRYADEARPDQAARTDSLRLLRGYQRG
jgi:hypothetical protein